MASSQTKSPTASNTPAGHWLNPTEAHADGSAAASVDTISGTGLYKEHYNFGFSLPTGAVILGIEVRCDLFETLGCVRERFEVALSWNAGTNYTTAKALVNSISTTETTRVFGSPTDLWGHSWTVSEINSNSFRVKTTLVSFSTCVSGTEYWDDWTRIKVYYSIGQSKTLEYVVFIPTVDIQKSSRYAVRLSPKVTKSLRYSIRGLKGLAKTLSYMVRTTYIDTNQKQLKYVVIQDHALLKTGKYTVKSPVQITKQLTYALNAQSKINSIGVHELGTKGRPAILGTKAGVVNNLPTVKREKNVIQSNKPNIVL